MIYSIDQLRIKRNSVKRPIQICWCAASTKNFIGAGFFKITTEEVEKINLEYLCDEVLEKIIMAGEESHFTSYLKVQLTYGVIRISQKKAEFLEAACESLISEIYSFTSSTLIKKSNKNPKLKTSEKAKKLEKSKRVKKKSSEQSETSENTEKAQKSKKSKKQSEQENQMIPENLSVDVYKTFPQNAHGSINLLLEEEDAHEIAQLSFGFRSSSKTEEITELLRQVSVGNRSLNETLGQIRQEYVDLLESPTYQDQLRTPARRCARHGIPADSILSPSEHAKFAVSPRPKRRSKDQVQESPLTKMPRLEELEDTVMIPDPQIEGATVPQNIVPPESPSKQRRSESEEIDPQLPDLSIQNFKGLISVVKQKKNRKKYQKKKKFLDHEKCITIKPHKPTYMTLSLPDMKNYSKREPIDKLLNYPATMKRPIFYKTGRYWSEILLLIFSENIEKPCQDLAIQELERNIENLEVQEAVDQSRIPCQAYKDQTILEQSDIQNLLDMPEETRRFSFSLDGDKIQQNLPPMDDSAFENNVAICNRSEPMVVDEPAEECNAVINHIPEKFVDGIENQNQEILPKVKRFKAADSNTDFNSPTRESQAFHSLVSDFFAFIQLLWNELEKKKKSKKQKGRRIIRINFDQIIIPEKNNATITVKYLMYCFHLEKIGKLYLEQQKPYSELYIVRPN